MDDVIRLNGLGRVLYFPPHYTLLLLTHFTSFASVLFTWHCDFYFVFWFLLFSLFARSSNAIAVLLQESLAF